MSKRSWDVAIWGIYPPPYGGMATHIVRLLDCLQQEGIRARVYNRVSDGQDPPRAVSIRRNQILWFIKFALWAPERSLYVFTGRPGVRFLAYLLKVFRGKRYILRIGEEHILRTFERSRSLARWMTLVALRNAEYIMPVSPHLADSIVQQGIDPAKVHLIPGFILPADRSEEPPDEVIEFARSHTPVLAANGQLWLGERGNMYGLDLLLSVLPRIREQYPRVGLMLSTYDSEINPGKVRNLRQCIENAGPADAVFLRSEQHVFWPMLKYTDVFLRPTRSEGDSSSIREAIWLGVPVVASNATPRPEPSVLFTNGEPESFLNSIREVLADLPRQKQIFAATPVSDYASPVVAIIRNTLA